MKTETIMWLVFLLIGLVLGSWLGALLVGVPGSELYRCSVAQQRGRSRCARSSASKCGALARS